MGIDIAVIALMVIALVKGYRKGLVVALFSLLAIVLGAAAALKLSGNAANWLAETIPSAEKWIPFLSFLLVFLVVVIAVRLLAKLLEETLEWTMLGWANKLGGMLLFCLLYLIVASIAVFYADRLGWISSNLKSSSVCYAPLCTIAPAVMEGLGKLIPVFQDLFTDLERVFESASS